MNGALPQNEFWNLSHSPKSVGKSVIFIVCSAALDNTHLSVHYGYSCIGIDARSNEKPYSTILAALDGLHSLHGACVGC